MRYVRIAVLFLLFTFPLGDLATPLSPRWEDMRLKHSWDETPENWECLGLPPVGTMIDLHVALKHHNEDALTDALKEVSNPRHPRYGAYLSKQQLADLVAPHPDTLNLVHSWLEYHHIPSSSVSVTHDGSSLTITGVPVSKANNLLGASYKIFAHTTTNETIVRTVGYSLPATLHEHVQTVVPTTYFSSPLTQTLRRISNGTAAEQIVQPAPVVPATPPLVATPSILRWMYSTFAYQPTAMNRNVLAVTGYIGEYPSHVDLARYMHKYRSDGIDATCIVVMVNDGEYEPNRPGVEASLDLQIAAGMAYPTPHIFYSTGAAPDGDTYIHWLNYMLSLEMVPPTITTSYGNYEKLFPEDYAVYVCSLFARLGLRGASVLFASGDKGVGDGDCRTKDGTVQFTPLFPATCPYVTAVGGTANFPEVAASLSGGGFSNYFERPDYQQLAVSTFLQNLSYTYHGFYNSTGRGIPDIAAQAMRIPFFVDGDESTVHGTSGATPIVASVISLLNDYLLSEGKPPLGFLNPWLYSVGFEGLNDITSGSNPGCNTGGFSAISGWDPVTGLGTPDFKHLQYILDLADISKWGK